MFAYCGNNPVNYMDDTGTMMKSTFSYKADFEGGAVKKTTKAEEVEDYFTKVNDFHLQQQALKYEITVQQIEFIQNGASAAWNAYNFSVELGQEAIMYQAKLTLDMFDSPEDIERSIDIIEATVSFSIAVYEVATIVTVANPPVGAVIWAIAGVVWGGRAICRACQ